MLETLQQAVARVQALPARAAYRDKLTHTFGVVLESDVPRQTKGSDLIQTVKLADDSLAEPIELCIFCARIEHMPQPLPGDVLELRFVCVQFYNDRPQLFAKMAPPHGFGFLLYRPVQPQPADVPVPVPIQLYNAGIDSKHARRRLPELRPVQQRVLGSGGTTQEAGAVYLRKVRDLAPPEREGQRPLCVDMRVQVLAVDQRCPEQGVVMFVWDATDARPIPANLQMLPSEWKGVELSVPHPRRRSLPLVPQPPDVLVAAELPPLGTALPVVVLPGALTALPQVGDWIKIKVVGVTAVQGQWQVVLGKCSRLTPSQPAQGWEAAYTTRLANQDTSEWPQDVAQLATTCSLPGLPRLTIRQVLQRTACEKQQGPFKVQLRLIGYVPQDVAGWCKARKRSSSGGGGTTLWEWAAHLLLEDATGELRALLLGDEATSVLGLPPKELRHEEDVLQLQDAVRHLSSVDEGGGVWMEAALTPLYPVTPQQQQGQAQGHGQQEPGASPSGGEQPPAAAPAPTLFVMHNAVCRFIEQQQQQGQQQQQQQQEDVAGRSPAATG